MCLPTGQEEDALYVAITFSEEVSIRSQLELLEEKEISVVRYPFQFGLPERKHNQI